MKLHIILIICVLYLASSVDSLFCCGRPRTISKPAEVTGPQTSTTPPQTQQGSGSNPQDSTSTKIDIFDFIQLDKSVDSIGTKDMKRFFEGRCKGYLSAYIKENLTIIRDFIVRKHGSDGRVTRGELHEEYKNNPAMIQIDLNDRQAYDPKVYSRNNYKPFEDSELKYLFCIPEGKVSKLLQERDQRITLSDLKYWYENGKLPVGPNRTGGNE